MFASSTPRPVDGGDDGPEQFVTPSSLSAGSYLGSSYSSEQGSTTPVGQRTLELTPQWTGWGPNEPLKQWARRDVSFDSSDHEWQHSIQRVGSPEYESFQPVNPRAFSSRFLNFATGTSRAATQRVASVGDLAELVQSAQPRPLRFRYRYYVLFCCWLALLLVYAQRLSLWLCIDRLADVHRWSPAQTHWLLYGYFIAFFVSVLPATLLVVNASSPLLTGKRLIAALVVLNSAVTVAFPFAAAAAPFAVPLALQLLSGLLVSPLLAAVYKLLARWLPCREFAFAVGCLWTAPFCASACFRLVAPLFGPGRLADPVAAVNALFLLVGGAPFVWLVAWSLFVSAAPEEHPFIAERELDEISPHLRELKGVYVIRTHSIGSLRQHQPFRDGLDPVLVDTLSTLARSPPVWSFALATTALFWTAYLVVDLAPAYLAGRLAVDFRAAQLFACLADALIVVACLAAAVVLLLCTADAALIKRVWAVDWLLLALLCLVVPFFTVAAAAVAALAAAALCLGVALPLLQSNPLFLSPKKGPVVVSLALVLALLPYFADQAVKLWLDPATQALSVAFWATAGLLAASLAVGVAAASWEKCPVLEGQNPLLL